MGTPIRHRRRNRHRRAQALREADALALQKINNSYLLSAASWGGYRCPDCGKAIRPHQLVNVSGRIGDGYIDGCYAQHEGCAPDKNWEIRAIARASRRHRYWLRRRIDNGFVA